MFHLTGEMSKTLAGNGNGNGTGGLLPPAKKRTAPSAPGTPTPEARESRVTFQTRDGLELRGTPVRITRHHIVFEVFHPSTFPQLS